MSEAAGALRSSPGLAYTGRTVEGPADRLFDLAFAPYRPLRPTAGKDRGDALLAAALAAAGAGSRWEAPLQAIQRDVGGRAIWGASLADGRWRWRLRLENPGRARLVDALRRALGPGLAVAPALVDDGAYEVLGVDLDERAAATGRIDALRLHVRGAGAREVAVWRCDGERRELAEEVLIVEAKREIALALPRIKAGRVVDLAGDRRLLGRVLIPELFACRHLHVVRRPGADADALVYSGVNVDQFAWFLGRFGYPGELRERVSAGRERLDHLLFDVEVAYRQDGAAIVYPETTFYGAL